MDLRDLLRLEDVPENARIKLYRHSDPPAFVRRLRRLGHFDAYQALQAQHVFDCDLVISVIALDARRAELYGIYEVKGHHRLDEDALQTCADQNPWWRDCPSSEHLALMAA